MSRGFPSMTALLGLLAVAGYQHRDKIAEMLGGLGQSGPGATGQSGTGGFLNQLSQSLGGASAGGLLGGGLGELVDRFKQSGHGETAESWVGTGPNKPVTPPQLEQAIGPTASFDASVSLLAIDVIPEPEKAAAEMRRVTRPGGVVACGTSDFGGGNYSFLMLLDIGAVFDEGFRALREYLLPRRLVRLNGQAQLWRQTGFTDVVEVPIVVNFDYESFDDYWTSQATGPTRTAQRLQAMPVDRRDEIQHHVRLAYLYGAPDGPRSYAHIIRAVRGIVP